VSKKTKKPIKLRKPEKNNRKNQIMKKNRLEKLKNKPVQFDFGFKRLKLNKPNRTGSNKKISGTINAYLSSFPHLLSKP